MVTNLALLGIVLYGISLWCMVLHVSALYQMVLHGMALYHCWLWRAGCISKDTYLLYFSIFLSPDNKYIKTNKGGQIYWASINEDKSFSGPAGSVICADGKWRIRWRPIRSYWVAVGESVIPEHQSSGIRNSTKLEPGRTAATTVPYILYILHCNGWVCEEENIARIANAVMLLSLKYLEKVTSLQSHLISPRSLIFYPWSLICYPWSLIIDPDPRSYIHKPVGVHPRPLDVLWLFLQSSSYISSPSMLTNWSTPLPRWSWWVVTRAHSWSGEGGRGARGREVQTGRSTQPTSFLATTTPPNQSSQPPDPHKGGQVRHHWGRHQYSWCE